MKQTPIFDLLYAQSQHARIRFCMPGHKGTLDPCDVTEAGEMDNLLHPAGALKQAHALAAKAYGAREVAFSVNGSTGGVLALWTAFLREGDRVLAGADSHFSAASGAIFSGALPTILPQRMHGQLPLPAQAADVEAALRADPAIRAVWITSPNYYGLCADVPRIAASCRAHGALLLVDAAHGAHFGFAPQLPPQPVQADAWVVSMHKTLCVANQGALVCVGQHAPLAASAVFSALHRVQTTSPSWPLLAQMDAARAQLCASAAVDYERLCNRIQAFLLALQGSAVCPAALPEGIAHDPTRVVLDVTRTGRSGFVWADELAQQGIWIEMADAAHLVLICTPQDTEEDFDALARALHAVKAPSERPASPVPPPTARLQHSPRDAAYGTMTLCSLTGAVGRISAQCVCCYPPGTVTLWPGARITAAQVQYLTQMAAQGASLTGVEMQADGPSIWICDEEAL